MKTQTTTTTTNEDENMTNSEIFKRAHAIAKATRAIVGDYRIAFSLALKDIYNTITKKDPELAVTLGVAKEVK